MSSSPLRVLIGEIKHEANTFSPVATTLQSFRDYHYYEGEACAALRGTRTEVAAFLDVADAEGWRPVFSLATMAMSSGKVTAETYARLKRTLLSSISAAGRLDAVLLALHGAMVVDGIDDAEGDLLAATRRLVGNTPIAASLDLHGVVTTQMASNADILVGFDTCPHTDLYETGARTASLLAALLRGRLAPAMALVRVPLIVAPDTMDTTDGPLGDVIAQAKALEGHDGVVSASVFCAQPWLDIPPLASAVLVASDGDPRSATQAAQRLARYYWRQRRRFTVDLHSPDEAVALAVAEGRGPVVFSDSADSIGSGAAGDATGVLRALLAHRNALPGAALATVVDPVAAAQAAAAGVGAHVELMVGGRLDTEHNTPVCLQGRVINVFDGRFRLSGPSYAGLEMNMGQTAVVQAGAVSVVMTSLPTWTHHPDFYRSVGLEPREALIVITKSNILFKASYRDIARRIIWVLAPGLSSPDVAHLPFTRVTRPLYPLDDMEAFDDRATIHQRR